MKKIILFIAVLSSCSSALNAQGSLWYSFFNLLNNQVSMTDIRVLSVFGSADDVPPPLMGYLDEIHSDTLFIKVLYKERVSSGWGNAVSREDTFYNVSVPVNVNYLNVSGNMLLIDSTGQVTDTLWNETDSTFALRPVGIKDIGKNSSNIIVYPNPAQSMLTLKAAPAYTKAVIYNTAGRCIGRHRYTPAKSIDISTLAPGVYYLKLMGKKEEVVGSTRFLVGR